MSILDSIQDAISTLRDSMQSDDNKRRELIRAEAALGAKLFGEVPAGRSRSFFCLDKNTWIWHEAWVDESGQKVQVTTRYSVYSNTVIKTQNEVQVPMDLQELNMLNTAVKAYYPLVASKIYGVSVPISV
ncbi:hypothetical protein KA529_01170 [Candidatus Saccharibacteria bacterium]|jgi:hypothetical protein|nr:hypothetical protein [Candidatus Saccharibacteria bacterium]